MRLYVDTSQVSFQVSREFAERTDQDGKQRKDKRTDQLMWTAQLVAVDEEGAEVLNVTVLGDTPPKVTKGQPVTPVELQALPWAQNGRNGVAFRAKTVQPVAVPSSGKSSSSS